MKMRCWENGRQPRFEILNQFFTDPGIYHAVNSYEIAQLRRKFREYLGTRNSLRGVYWITHQTKVPEIPNSAAS